MSLDNKDIAESCTKMLNGLDKDIAEQLIYIFEEYKVSQSSQEIVLIVFESYFRDMKRLKKLKLQGSYKDYRSKIESLKKKLVEYSSTLLEPVEMMLPLPEPHINYTMRKELEDYLYENMDAVRVIYELLTGNNLPREEKSYIDWAKQNPDMFAVMIIVNPNATEAIETYHFQR